MRPSSRCNNSRQIYWGIFPSLKLFKVYIPSIQSISLFQSHPVRHFLQSIETRLKSNLWFDFYPRSPEIYFNLLEHLPFSGKYIIIKIIQSIYSNYSKYIIIMFNIFVQCNVFCCNTSKLDWNPICDLIFTPGVLKYISFLSNHSPLSPQSPNCKIYCWIVS